mmetsp:Transcript_106606/g.188770  ORF Transcript_106606/g.188770 Transcript_106606/m.188770 type:complete len:357 (-) Transcript_106606:21-1091(-)
MVCHYAVTGSLVTVLLSVASAQVQNLRFYDTDTDANKVGGSVIFDLPAAGHANIATYSLRFASNCDDATCRNGQIAIGCTGSYEVSTLKAGAWTSVLPVGPDKDISTGCSGACTHMILRPLDHAGQNTNQDACVRIFDNPSGYGRAYTLTVAGQSNAQTWKEELVKDGLTQEFFVDMEMVATAKWDSGTSSVVETDFGAANTAIWQLSFSSPATEVQVTTALTARGLNPYLPVAWTGAGASTNHGLGTGQVNSVLGGHNPIRPDPDVARHYVRSCIRLQIAYAATVNWKGDVRVFTTSTAGTQTGIQDVADVYMGYESFSFSNAGYDSSGLTSITGHVTSTAANCEQVDGGSATCV